MQYSSERPHRPQEELGLGYEPSRLQHHVIKAFTFPDEVSLPARFAARLSSTLLDPKVSTGPDKIAPGSDPARRAALGAAAAPVRREVAPASPPTGVGFKMFLIWPLAVPKTNRQKMIKQIKN
mmetsp:Transcript_16082/g.23359  ORF Transcript_16082/g.23359 Transcript_16082/m.23359 type:complete len:123 (+) Transcript_16082:136-504(+)